VTLWTELCQLWFTLMEHEQADLEGQARLDFITQHLRDDLVKVGEHLYGDLGCYSAFCDEGVERIGHGCADAATCQPEGTGVATRARINTCSACTAHSTAVAGLLPYRRAVARGFVGDRE
jgi:hypothetical protein